MLTELYNFRLNIQVQFISILTNYVYEFSSFCIILLMLLNYHILIIITERLDYNSNIKVL